MQIAPDNRDLCQEVVLKQRILLETTIDDMSPQIYEHVNELLFGASALDVALSPVQTKKNRPGTLLSVLCRPEQADELSMIIFSETTTLGIRRIPVTCQALPQRFEQIETPYGALRVKVAAAPDGTERVTLEYEGCRRLAREVGVPPQVVVGTVLRQETAR